MFLLAAARPLPQAHRHNPYNDTFDDFARGHAATRRLSTSQQTHRAIWDSCTCYQVPHSLLRVISGVTK